jgi:predicted Rossmann-fold nucleotide-binding protein
LVLDFVKGSDESAPKARKLVGIMGGHVEDRTSKYYAMVAGISYRLTKAGYCALTGGGPGVMEAGNLGAYMSGYSTDQLKDAISVLSEAPSYPPLDPSDPNNESKRKEYVKAALKVRQRYPNGANSLGVPTWAYPDEPTGQFASHIAKYFANSIREDGLLAIAAYGVIFGPGAAGTSQEIFQDAVHNSYWSFG